MRCLGHVVLLISIALASSASVRAEDAAVTRLAYTTTYEDAFGRAYHGLYTINLDGRDARLLSVQPLGIAGIDWRPDGTVAYVDSWNDRLSVWTVSPVSLDLDWFTTSNLWDDSYPSWSPDGTRFAMMSNRAGNDDVYIVNAAALDADRVEYAAEHDPISITHTPADERWPAWSPMGDAIAFVSDRSGPLLIYLTDPDGADVRPLMRARDFPQGITRPPMAWSPDGSVLAFSTRVGDGYAIHTVRPADGSIARLTEGDRLDRCPTYSPDGRRIAFVSAGRLEDGQEGAGSIWVMDADGRNLNHVANGLGGSVTLVDWSPALPAAR